MSRIVLTERIPPRRSLDQSMVPLINVVFLLLIFFLVAGDLSKTLADGLMPPRSVSEQLLSIHDQWLILDTRGQLHFEKREYTLTEFVEYGEKSDLKLPGVLQLRVDQSVESRYLLPLLDELKRFGVEKVVLLTLSSSGM